MPEQPAVFTPNKRPISPKYAELVQIKAIEQGYAISQALTLNGNYYGIRVNETVGGHVGNVVLINDAYYYFEPNTEKFYIKKIIDRD